MAVCYNLDMNEKIFVNIASFRDPSLVITIKSALLHADHPENLVFGVGLQYYDDEVPDLSFIKKENLRTISYDVDTRPGVVRVRYETSNLIQDEKYFYMIDSHTLFSKSWDTEFKESLKVLESLSGHDRVCLSGNGTHENQNYFRSHKYMFNPEIVAMNNNEGAYFVKTGDYTRSHHADCSYFFTYGKYIKEVGLDKHSMFLNEELYMSWRTFMAGWDIYVPSKRYAFQNPQAYFNIVWEGNRHKRTYTRDDNKNSKADEVEMLMAFVYNKGKYAIENPARTTEDFWDFVGSKESYLLMLGSENFRKMLIEHDLYRYLLMTA